MRWLAVVFLFLFLGCEKASKTEPAKVTPARSAEPAVALLAAADAVWLGTSRGTLCRVPHVGGKVD